MAQLMCNFVSYSLRGGVDIAITLPTISSCDFGPDKKPCHTPQAPYPVLYLLHGYGNDYKCWHRYTSMERYAEERRIAVVTCSVGNKCYMNNAFGENYYDFIAQELPEFICGFPPRGRYLYRRPFHGRLWRACPRPGAPRGVVRGGGLLAGNGPRRPKR